MSPDPSTMIVQPLAFVRADSGTSFAETERTEAKTRGYAEGYSAGSVAVTKRARERQAEIDRAAQAQAQRHETEQRQALDALGAAADALVTRTVPALETIDESLIEAALELAEAILGHELRDAEHGAAAALRRATVPVDPAAVRAVRMHPMTAAALPMSAVEALEIRIEHDPQLHPGDAVADLHDGFLDARITSTLARCKALLNEARP